MIMDQLISFKTAKLAKEKGFNEPCFFHYYYNEDDNLYHTNDNGAGFSECPDLIDFLHNSKGFAENQFLTPTQSQLQKWLREKHGIQVWVDAGPLNWNRTFKWTIYIITPKSKNNIDFLDCEIYEDDFEDALEKGLFEALKLVP